MTPQHSWQSDAGRPRPAARTTRLRDHAWLIGGLTGFFGAALIDHRTGVFGGLL